MEDDYTTYLKKYSKNEQSRAQANETFPPRTFWVTLLPTSSNKIGVNVGTTQHNPQTAFLGPSSLPSSLLKTSDGKIVRQLLTSIKQTKKKTAGPYISSLVTLC